MNQSGEGVGGCHLEEKYEKGGGKMKRKKRSDCGVKELESKKVKLKQQGGKTVLNGERRKTV
jgi:hypothetical protein